MKDKEELSLFEACLKPPSIGGRLRQENCRETRLSLGTRGVLNQPGLYIVQPCLTKTKIKNKRTTGGIV